MDKKIKNMSKIITHDGAAHLDEIAAIAALRLASPNLKNSPIHRTRDISDQELNDPKTIIIDVGSHYEPHLLNFDHHQNGAPTRNAYEPYAAAGLIWKAFSLRICKSILETKDETFAKKVASEIEDKLIKFIDLMDCCGVNYEAVKDPKQLAQISGMGKFISISVQDDATFLKAVEMMEIYLLETIKETGRRIKFTLELHKNPPQGPILEIPEQGYYWQNPLQIYSKVKFVVFFRENDNTWGAQTVPNTETFFPKSWCGKTNKELEDETGIKGAVFCHKSAFFAVATTREQIFALITKALA
jgi:uncharacterized UPF0160 family protein